MLINRLPEIAEQKRISIRALSRMTGITYTTIRAVYHRERRSVQLEVLEAICRALAIQPGDIYQFIPFSQPVQPFDLEGGLEEERIAGHEQQIAMEIPGQSVDPKRDSSGQRSGIMHQSRTDDWNVWETE